MYDSNQDPALKEDVWIQHMEECQWYTNWVKNVKLYKSV